MCELDYKRIRTNLLEVLSVSELGCLCTIIGKETNLRIIHQKIHETLDSDKVIDPLFCKNLIKKIDNKQVSLYELISFSRVLADGKINLIDASDS